MQEQILSALRWRYATKTFDPNKKVSETDIKTILEAGRLTPSSFGIEAWKFLVVENPELRAKLRAVGFDQKQITDASHLIVVARRTDVRENIAKELVERTSKTLGIDPSKLTMLEQMLQGSIMGRNDDELDAWIRSQTYIPLGVMMETASLLKVDNAALEGFNPQAADEILGLAAKNLKATYMIVLGYRETGDEYAGRPKVRRPYEEVVENIKRP